ncbi:MAG: hypothetical protein JWO86_8026 [Myxococcaceae bacterium]|jgi:hypothetical protein|nr:hypothetical protein [Myxococcaceae bacterium]MEA2747421.1 hypothetical protein [Myxococcales bacterium]
MSKQSTESPIDDLTFDVITVLRNKAKALAAYDQYLRDADAEDDDELHDLFTQMRKQDEEDVQVLKEVLARRLEDDLGYDDTTDEDDDEGDDDVDVGEDYSDEDEEEVEAPTASDAEARGDDAAMTPPSASPPKRGESTQRHR